MAGIKLVLTDDWELPGNGTGDMRTMQFEPLQRLLSIYEKYNLRASIYAEVMQQIYHRRLGEKYPHLSDLAQKWDSLIRESYLKGHDVQLHIHSQWHNATYDNGRWNLSGNWSIANYGPEDIREMVRGCKTYLENLLKPINSDYACVSFRSGAWQIAPGEDIIRVLSQEGIVFDTSIIPGVVLNNKNIYLDYSCCKRRFLPYYVDTKDARRISDTETPLVEVPTFTFSDFNILELKGRILNKKKSATHRTGGAVCSMPLLSRLSFTAKKIARFLSPVFISDISSLTFDRMVTMIEAVRSNVRPSSLQEIPVILTNHTKALCDFQHISAFAQYLSDQKDIEVITLSEVAQKIKAGIYRPVLRI